MRLYIHFPLVYCGQKHPHVTESPKSEKTVKIGKSGLPVELPLDSFKEKKVVAYLQDSWAYNRAKDAITVINSRLRNSKMK